MKKSIFIVLSVFFYGIILLLTSCNDDLNIQQSYDFSIVTLPVQKRIKVGETAEIRCQLVQSGQWQQATYAMRYFQPDGKGELRSEDGLVFKPNDLYPIEDQTFRLYYTSHSDDQQVIDLYFIDNFGKIFTLSFSFNNDNTDEE